MAKKRGNTKLKRAEETTAQRNARIARGIGVPEIQIERGHLEEATIVDLDGALGGKRMSIVKVMLNRGGTAIDRWIANDKAGLFEEPQRNAIRYCQNLWTRAAGGVSAIDPSADRVDGVLGWSQHEALTELALLRTRIPRTYWDVYENVCRWDEEAGVAGSKLAMNSRSAIDAAKTAVAFSASLIAMWRRL